jgi:uncharacterized delta-60 repeat protein
VPDSGFGASNGVFISDYGFLGANGYDLKVLSSGKIVVAGSVYQAAGDGELALFRFSAKGKPDATFGGGDGLATLDMGPGLDEAWQLSPVADGKLLVGGWRQVGTSSIYDVALARFTGAGALDTTFGNGGSVHYGPTAGSDYVQSMIVTGNKIVVMLNSNGSKAGIMRLKLNGKKDTTFGGGDGLLFRNITGASEFHNMAVDSKGRFLLAGLGGSSIFVARLKSTYAIDTSFGSGGKRQSRTRTGSVFHADGVRLSGMRRLHQSRNEVRHRLRHENTPCHVE